MTTWEHLHNENSFGTIRYFSYVNDYMTEEKALVDDGQNGDGDDMTKYARIDKLVWTPRVDAPPTLKWTDTHLPIAHSNLLYLYFCQA